MSSSIVVDRHKFLILDDRFKLNDPGRNVESAKRTRNRSVKSSFNMMCQQQQQQKIAFVLQMQIEMHSNEMIPGVRID